jgi:CheY-like chemotaxis protein
MDGDITVQSHYGSGSTFYVNLLQRIADGEPFATVTDTKSKSVLVYEKRQVYGESLVRSIRDLGVKADLALTGEEFLSALAKKSYPFLFVAHSLFDEAESALQARRSSARIVLLTERNELLTPPNIRTITMPGYALPIANILNGIYEEIGANTSSARFSAPGAQVLVVDDIPTNLKVARGLMLPYKMQIHCAASGPEAIQMINDNWLDEAKRYDLVFMDHMMPNMDGIQALQEIRKRGGYFAELPIVALTANAVVGSKEMFLEKGFNDYISKPIDTAKLDEILSKWIPNEKKDKTFVPQARQSRSVSIAIESVDTRQGISMTGGSEEAYLDILATYIKDARDRLGTLLNFRQSIETAEPSPSALALFTTQVHALKSASASIGAAKLSADALALEMAGKNAALTAIKQNLGPFCNALFAITERIHAALPKQVDNAEETELSTTDNAGFAMLKEALAAEDIGKIDSILDDFSKRHWGPKMKEAMSQISDCVLVSDFEMALKTLSEQGIGEV